MGQVNGVAEDIVLKGQILDFIHPIGSLYWSTVNTDPSELFGGVWEQIKDTFILAAGDKYPAGTTGGSTEHRHSLSRKGGANFRKVEEIFFQGETTTAGPIRSDLNGRFWTTKGNMDSSITDAPGYEGIGLYGTTDDINTLPPYLVAYCWKRIS